MDFYDVKWDIYNVFTLKSTVVNNIETHFDIKIDKNGEDKNKQ